VLNTGTRGGWRLAHRSVTVRWVWDSRNVARERCKEEERACGIWTCRATSFLRKRMLCASEGITGL